MRLLFALIIGHAFADFVFQSDTMAKGKNRHRKTEPPPGVVYQPTWGYWITAHALVHGGVVWILTGSVWLCLGEVIMHALIDFGKCENWYGVHRDQAMHILCKVAWVFLYQ